MPLFFDIPAPTDFNAEVVGSLINNDLDKLKQLSTNTKITFHDYLKAVDQTNGQVIQNTECIKFLYEVGAIHKHQVMLDGAMGGNFELMKYAESKGEDIFYYKVGLYILMNPDNKARKQYLNRMLKAGHITEQQIREMEETQLKMKQERSKYVESDPKPDDTVADPDYSYTENDPDPNYINTDTWTHAGTGVKNCEYGGGTPFIPVGVYKPVVGSTKAGTIVIFPW